jgi:microcystin-dependent protein
LGQVAGSADVTVTVPQMAAHLHTMMAAAVPADLKAPAPTAVLSRSSQGNIYLAPDGNVGAMAPNMIGNTGGSKPHNNLMPYLVLNFCIALSGIFPSRG